MILSLIIVCVLDLVFPAKMDGTRYERVPSTESDESTKRKLRSSKQDESDEELAKEDEKSDEKKKEL